MLMLRKESDVLLCAKMIKDASSGVSKLVNAKKNIYLDDPTHEHPKSKHFDYGDESALTRRRTGTHRLSVPWAREKDKLPSRRGCFACDSPYLRNTSHAQRA